MFDSLTQKNKKDLYIYAVFCVVTIASASLLAYFSFSSLVHYKNRAVSGFYDNKSDPLKTSASSMTRQLVFIIIDGLSHADFGKLSALEEFKAKSVHAKIEILQPTLSITSWMTFMTGATPAVHGFVSPAGATLKYEPCENIFSSARGRTFKTAIFGHSDWKKAFGGHAEISYYASFKPDNSNVIQIDEQIMSNAISHIRYQKPQFSVIHLPGLDKTSHLFGRTGHEFRVHLQKLDDILRAFLTSSLVNDRYIVIASDHGHVARGGHGGGEADVTGAVFMLAGPGVVSGSNIKFLSIDQTDICPTICSLLGIPIPYLNSGSFLPRLFSFPDYVKLLKIKAVLAQKSLFYKNYIAASGATPSRLFNYEAHAAEIEKTAGEDYSKALVGFETYEKKLAVEFTRLTGDGISYKKLYRSFYLGFLLAAFLAFLVYKFKNRYRLFSALAQIVIFYSIYYGIYFFRGFGFSLSDFNDYAYFDSFMNNRRIEAACALLLSYTPLLLNCLFMHKRLHTWLNYVFFPVFTEFNFYLSFTLAAQCSWYVLNYGAVLTDSLPDMGSALKYYFDIQILIVTQALALAIAGAAILALALAAPKKAASGGGYRSPEVL